VIKALSETSGFWSGDGFWARRVDIETALRPTANKIWTDRRVEMKFMTSFLADLFSE
jgi:hypothetical protein